MSFYSWLTAGEKWLILKQFHCKWNSHCSAAGPSSLPSGLLPGVTSQGSVEWMFLFPRVGCCQTAELCIYCCFLWVSPLAAEDSVKHFLHRYPPGQTRCLCKIRQQNPSEFYCPCCCFRWGLEGFVWFELSSSARYNLPKILTMFVSNWIQVINGLR